MDDTLTTALAGGAIGTVLLGIAWAVARLSTIPGDLDRHDALLHEANEDLRSWVMDDHRRLRQELEGITNEHARRGLLYSSIHGAERAEAKTRALQAYRDRLREAQRKVAEVQSRETWVHALFRRTRSRDPLALTAPEQVEPVLNEWRGGVTRHSGQAEDAVPVHDPTRQTLEEFIADIQANPLEGPVPPTPEESEPAE